MPKQDISKLAGRGSRIQTELSGRLDELRSLQIVTEQFNTVLIPVGLNRIQADLEFVSERKTSLTPIKKSFLELQSKFTKEISKPFTKLLQTTNTTANKDFSKFKADTQKLPQEYKFQETCEAIDLILSAFNKLQSELQNIINHLDTQLATFANKFVGPEANLQVSKMERSAEKLAKEVARLAQKKANVDGEQLSLGNLLEKLQEIEGNSEELKSFNQQAPRF